MNGDFVEPSSSSSSVTNNSASSNNVVAKDAGSPNDATTATSKTNAMNRGTIPNDYAGTRLGPDFFVPILNADEFRKEKDGGVSKFFTEYVSKRRPCVLDFHPFESSQKLTKEDLSKCAGEETVRVERRDDNGFGTSNGRTAMTLNDFLRKLASSKTEREECYLSAQQQPDDADDDDDDPFALAPVKQLKEAGKIPSNIPLTGNLVLSACNMWIGNSVSGTSSGLHHDHHDNLYALLEGSKRFRLYSPDSAANMETRGVIERVHFNGRVSYVGSECRPDGVPVDLFEDDDDDDDDDEEEVVIGKGHDYKSDDDEEEGMVDRGDVDDYDELMKGEGDDDGDEEEDDEGEVVIGKGHDYQSDDDNDMEERGNVDDFDELMKDDGKKDADDDEEEEVVIGKGHDYKSDDDVDIDDRGDADDYDELMKKDDEEGPDNFSRVPTESLSDSATLSRDYPNFTKTDPYVVLLTAGQTLYLPTGWFHEITSLGRCHGTESSGFDPEVAGTHAALNYWYHPPDDLDSPTRPYRSDYWKRKGWLV